MADGVSGNASAVCPVCQREIAGTLASLADHVKSCRKMAKLVIKTKSQGVRLPPLPLTVTLPWTIRIPLVVSSQNQSQYAHWTVYAGIKKRWEKALSPLLLPVAGCYLQWSTWELTRVWAPPKRELDHANFIGGAKPIPDILEKAGVIENDKPKHFFCYYNQVRGEANYTLLTLLTVGDKRPEDFTSGRDQTKNL